MDISFGKCLAVVLLSISLAYVSKTCLKNCLENYLEIGRNLDKIEKTIAVSWNKTLKNFPDSNIRFHDIVIGINSDVDVIVRGSDLLQALGTTKEEEDNISPTDHEEIGTLKELQEIFSLFHSKGAGGERFMSNAELFAQVVVEARKLKDAEFYIGGNAALMAQTLSHSAPKSTKIVFSGPVGPVLQPLLNPNIMIPPNMKTAQDEYHLIMEFAKDELWAGKRAPAASRFIFSHDLTNGKMLTFENFLLSVKESAPDLIILTGFHLLESQTEAYWRKRVSEIASYIREIPKNIPIHLELASMAKSTFMKEIADTIFSLVHSIGLNEQELWLFCQAGGGPLCGGDSAEATYKPGVSNDIIYWMLDKYSNRNIPGSLLTRIHFHTLPFHVVATLQSSRWRHGGTSVVAGTHIASVQSCGDEVVKTEKVDLRLPERLKLTAGSLPSDCSPPADVTFDPNNPMVSWVTNGLQFFLSPVLVCKKPVKTVGLGDAISSTGLLYSGYAKEN